MGVILSTLKTLLWAALKTLVFGLILENTALLGYLVTKWHRARMNPGAQCLQCPHIRKVKSDGVDDRAKLGMDDFTFLAFYFVVYHLGELHYYHGFDSREWGFQEVFSSTLGYCTLLIVFAMWTSDSATPETGPGSQQTPVAAPSIIDALFQRTQQLRHWCITNRERAAHLERSVCAMEKYHRKEVAFLRSELFAARGTIRLLEHGRLADTRVMSLQCTKIHFQEKDLEVARFENDRLDRILVEFQGAFDAHQEREQKLRDHERAIRCWKTCFQFQEGHLTKLHDEVQAWKQRAVAAELDVKTAKEAESEAVSRERSMQDRGAVRSMGEFIPIGQWRAERNMAERGQAIVRNVRIEVEEE